MTDLGPAQPQVTAGNPFRFSLRALFLVLFVVSLAFSHLVTSRRLSDATLRLRLANDENHKLRQTLGYLSIEDADQLYAAASPQFLLEDLKWRWQVYIPRTGFQLHAVLDSIPREGIPAKEAKTRHCQLPRDEFTLDAAIRKNHSGQWELNVKVPTDPTSSQTISVEIPETYAAWLNPGKSGGGMRFDYGSAASGEPLVLVRHRRPKEFPDLHTEDDPEPCEGVMIWIDEN